MKTESLKKAQKKYFNKKLKEGWKSIRLFVPFEMKEKILNYKRELMREYYVRKTYNN